MNLALGLLVIVVALIPRLYEAFHSFSPTLYGDSVHYDASAVILLQRHYFSFWGYGPDAYVTPGYPLFLALCYRVAGVFSSSHHFAIHFTVVIQAVLSAITVGLMYWTARRFLRPVWAIVGVLLWALYPPTIWSITQILTETLFMILLWLFILLFFIAMEQKNVVWWAVCGFVLGLAGLVRPTVFPLVLAALIYGLVQLRNLNSLRPVINWFGANLVGFLIAVVPWWVRNLRLFHHLVLSDTEVGNPLLFGSDPNFLKDVHLGAGLSETAQKQLAIHRIEQGFLHHFWYYLHWYTIGKISYLFGTPWFPPLSAHAPGLMHMWLNTHLIWVVLGAIGLLIGLANRNMRFIGVLALFLLVIQLPFIPINRYAFPIMSMLFLGVGYSLQLGFARGGRRRNGRYPT